MLNYSPFYLKTHLPTLQSINMFWKKTKNYSNKILLGIISPGLYFSVIFHLFSLYFSILTCTVILKQLCTLLSYKYKQKRVAVIALISEKLELKAKIIIHKKSTKYNSQ